MKKTLLTWRTLLMVLLASIGFYSCGDDEEDPTMLSVDVNQLLFTSDSESKILEITSNSSWTISGADKDWLSVSPTSGSNNKKVVVTANKNTETESRDCQLIIETEDGSVQETVLVKQEECEAKLTVDVAELTFPSEGQTQTFSVVSNGDWVITGNPNWLTVSPGSGTNEKKIVVTAFENKDIKARSCQLQITASKGDAKHSISVVQKGQEEQLLVDISEVNFEGKEGLANSIKITSNTSWSISGAADWLTLSSTQGKGDYTITLITKSENNSSSARECILSIKTESGKLAQVRVVQKGLLASGCNIRPNVIITLANGMAFDYLYDSNVKYYYVKLYDPRKVERMTNDEIIADMSVDINDRDTPNDSYINYWNLPPNTDFTVCTVGFDKLGNHGELYKENIRTKDDHNAAVAYITDVRYDETHWMWSTEVNGRVRRYYQVFIENHDLHDTNDAAIAWFFNKWMREDPDSFEPYAQGTSFTRNRGVNTIFDLVTWAIDEKTGDFSSMINRFQGRIEQGTSKMKKFKCSIKDNPFKRNRVQFE